MSKGLMQSLTKFGLPLGLGVVGSLSLVVWSQKPAVSTAVAAAPAPITVTAEEAASFDPFQPTAKVVEAAPAVSATPMAAVTINNAEMGPTVNGGHLGTVSLGSNAQPTISIEKETSVATRMPTDFTMGAVAADSSGGDDCVKITASCAKITVGDAVINVLSSAKINLP